MVSTTGQWMQANVAIDEYKSYYHTKTKSKITGIILLLLLLLIFISSKSSAQHWDRRAERVMLQNWSININGGYTSYYGDLSTHDDMFFGKLLNESGPAYGLTISKELGRAVSISGQVISGNLVCRKNNTSIETQLFEYNLQGKINLIELASNQRVYRRFGLLFFAGVGNFIFDTKMKEVNNEIITITEHHARVPEFVYFLGGGFSYDLSPRLSINTELSIRQCQNDKVDIIVKNGDFDYYSYMNIGITYRIMYLFSKPSEKENEQLFGWEKTKPKYRPRSNY